MLNILLVDDEGLDRYLIKRSIQKAGIKAKFVELTSGEQALKYFNDQLDSSSMSQDFPPDFVFLDLLMPAMGGLEFLEVYCSLYSEHGCLSNTPFLVLTSSLQTEDKATIMQYDFVKTFAAKSDISTDVIRSFLSAGKS